MKTYNIQQNIGKAKYVVNYHNGTTKHKDGSPFFDVKLLNNKTELAKVITKLKDDGYTQN